MGSVYVFLADGFEETEALAVVDCFRRAAVNTVLVSVNGSDVVTSSHNVRVGADVKFDDANFDDAEILFLPGGMPGTKNLEAHNGLMSLLDKHVKAGKKVAAICAAPSILGHKGYLNGKKATCFPGFDVALTEGGATYTANLVEECGNFITAKGAGAALALGYAIIGQLIAPDAAEKLKKQMIFEY